MKKSENFIFISKNAYDIEKKATIQQFLDHPVHKSYRLLEPCELQMAYQKILDGELTPAPGEDKLAALTAGERAHWAITRKTFFNNGINKASLDAIERAAFVVILDDEECFYDQVTSFL